MNGIIILNKPAGFTSLDAVAKLRGILRERRIGHAGTLDPQATGVLVVLVGNAARCSGILPNDDKVYEAGALITGGHSIHDDEPKYGLAVTGFVHPDRVLTNSGARPGDVLFLTKPLGIGILSTAAKADMVSEAGEKRMFELMTTLNRSARDVMVKYDVHACTDVTGFGLLGHAFEMMEGSDVQAVIDTKAIDLIPEARELARFGLIPAGAYRNRTFAEKAVELSGIDLEVQDMLFDPQTSGGLLIACAPGDADRMFDELQKNVPSAQRIGTVQEYEGGKRIFLR